MELTPAGLVPFSGSPGVYDLRFHSDNSTLPRLSRDLWSVLRAGRIQTLAL
jgi:hypothetical protein